MQALITRWKPRLRKVPGYRAARFIYRLVKSVESRNEALLSLRPPKGLYQPYGATSADRYPDIFLAVRKFVEGDASVRILRSVVRRERRFSRYANISLRQISSGSTSIHSISRSADSAV